MISNKSVISQTPLRISLIGGGSDIKDHYALYGGSVVSFAIDQYIYVQVNDNNRIFGSKFIIAYSQNEKVNSIDEIENGIVRESLRLLDLDTPLYISTSADLPASSGLGSSSSFTVGLLHALHEFKGEKVSSEQLAEEACTVEIELLGKKIGKQDQYAAAFGGLNHIQFNLDGKVTIKSLGDTGHYEEIFNSLVLVWTGLTRDANVILIDQVSKSFENASNLISLSKSSKKLALELESKKFDKNLLGPLLTDSWKLKRELSEKISNSHIDGLLEKCIECGAKGGKLLGAGGGGFLLMAVENIDTFWSSMKDEILIPVRASKYGSRIIFSR
jgi:D-glycero-alpha-D-manno-heptose-7-phosphate kinase